MKRFVKTLISTAVILFMAGTPTIIVKASPPRQDLTSNPAAEEYIRTEMLVSSDVDLATAFPNEAERVVGADFIVALWQDPDYQAIPFFKLRNATILGDIQAEGITIPFNVELHNSTFMGGVNLANTDVKTFRIDDSTVAGPVKLGRMVVNGDLALYNSTFESGVTLFGANIIKNLFAKSSEFLSTEPVPDSAHPFELWTTQVGQTAEFTDSLFKGRVQVDDAKVGVELRFNNVVFEGPASFKNIQVGSIANFQASQFKDWADFDGTTFDLDAKFPEASFGGKATFTNIRVGNKVDFQKATFHDEVGFQSSIIDRDAAFTGSRFDGNANFDYLAVARFLNLDQTTFNQNFSFIYTIVGWPTFKGAVFNGSVNFEGMQASNDFDFTDASYNYLDKPFSVNLAKVDGHAVFEGFTAPAGLSLDHNQFGELRISTKENGKFDFVNLTSTQVTNDLTLENVDMDALSAEGVTVGDSTTFKNVNVATSLNMGNASIGFFTMDQFSWPKTPKSFNLRGMTYSDIGVGDQELNENTWGVLLDMVDQSAYSPQAYRTLAQFLTEKGRPDWAADVELNQKRRERDEILTPRSGPWFWSWFLDIFSGYGQRPDFAFVWSALVIIIGAIVFRREQDMVILDDTEAKPPYNPVLYSFALFLPYIDLDIASKWDPRPERKFAGIYKHIHRLMGWVLMPIALLTFGGIIS